MAPLPSTPSLPVSATSAGDSALLGSSDTGMGPFLPLIVVLCVLFLLGGVGIFTICLDWYLSEPEPVVRSEVVRYPRTIDVLKYAKVDNDMRHTLGEPVACRSSCGIERSSETVKVPGCAATRFMIRDYNERRPIPGLSPVLGSGGDGAVKLKTPEAALVLDRYSIWLGHRGNVDSPPSIALSQEASVVTDASEAGCGEDAMVVHDEGITRDTAFQTAARPTRADEEQWIDAQDKGLIRTVEDSAGTGECAQALVVSNGPSVKEDVSASTSGFCPDGESMQTYATESEVGGSDKENEGPVSLWFSQEVDSALEYTDSVVIAPSVSFESELSQVIGRFEGLSIKDDPAEESSMDSVVIAPTVSFDSQISQVTEGLGRLSIQDDSASESSMGSVCVHSSTRYEDNLAQVIEGFKRLSIKDEPLTPAAPAAIAVGGGKAVTVPADLTVLKIIEAPSPVIKEIAKLTISTISDVSHKVLTRVQNTASPKLGLGTLRRIKDRGKDLVVLKRRDTEPDVSVPEEFARRRKANSSSSKVAISRTWRFGKFKGENSVRGKSKAAVYEAPPPRIYARDVIRGLCAADASHALLPHYY